MSRRWWPVATGVLVIHALIALEAASVSRENAELFIRKLMVIEEYGRGSQLDGTRRTTLTEDEVNSWFAYAAQPLLPAGVTQPRIAIPGQGRVEAQAVVDLGAAVKARPRAGSLSLVGGRVPVRVAGTLRTDAGVGQFDVEEAAVAGVPVPVGLVQELLSFYSQTPDRPEGIRLYAPFILPANIRDIEVTQGQAVVVQ